MRRLRHDFCSVTSYCTRCGMPAWHVSARQTCISQSDNIISLDWWRKLKAHQALTLQLVNSVAAQVLKSDG